MAFNLQKVLRALLFSSNQPLSIKDVQDIFARFHEQAPAAAETDEEPSSLAVSNEEIPSGEVPSENVEGSEPVASENAPMADPEAPSLKPAELMASESVAEFSDAGTEPLPVDQTEEVVAQSPADDDAELYHDVPSLITAAQIREAMDAIASEMRATNDIYMLIEGPAGYRIMTHPRFARWIRIMRDEPPPVKLSQSALETLAVVAYRQPVTRSEIESIRGVSAEAGLSKLMERELVYITGRADLPGRPLQYGTTDKFLEFVGVKSLVELPASDVLSPRQIDAWLQNAAKVTPPADADMGLPLEEGEGETPNLAEVSVEQSAHPFETTGASDTTQAAPVETDAPLSGVETDSSETAPAPQPDSPEQTTETTDGSSPEKPQ